MISRKRPQPIAPIRPRRPAAGARSISTDAAWDTAQGKITCAPPVAAETREIDGGFHGLLVGGKPREHRRARGGNRSLQQHLQTKTDQSGAVRYIYLDAKTFLDRRQTGVLKAPGRQEQFVMDFSNWRPIEGVLFPMNLDEDRTGRGITQSYATYTEKIELNVPLDDALFATPAGAGH